MLSTVDFGVGQKIAVSNALLSKLSSSFLSLLLYFPCRLECLSLETMRNFAPTKSIFVMLLVLCVVSSCILLPFSQSVGARVVPLRRQHAATPILRHSTFLYSVLILVVALHSRKESSPCLLLLL